MNWTELLKAEIQSSYETTERLLALVDPSSLQWKPATGSNWMTMGFGACEKGPTVAFQTDPGGLWLSLEGQVADSSRWQFPRGDRRRYSKIDKT